jgi:hypothetical protein
LISRLIHLVRQFIAERNGGSQSRVAGSPDVEQTAPAHSGEVIRCRVAACREALGDGKEWSFYLINDGDAPLDLALLEEIGYEWGDRRNCEATDVRVVGLAPKTHKLIWRDDGDGVEGRMDLSIQVRSRDRPARLSFEFPILYKQWDLPRVKGLGKRGWEAKAWG